MVEKTQTLVIHITKLKEAVWHMTTHLFLVYSKVSYRQLDALDTWMT